MPPVELQLRARTLEGATSAICVVRSVLTGGPHPTLPFDIRKVPEIELDVVPQRGGFPAVAIGHLEQHPYLSINESSG